MCTGAAAPVAAVAARRPVRPGRGLGDPASTPSLWTRLRPRPPRAGACPRSTCRPLGGGRDQRFRRGVKRHRRGRGPVGPLGARRRRPAGSRPLVLLPVHGGRPGHRAARTAPARGHKADRLRFLFASQRRTGSPASGCCGPTPRPTIPTWCCTWATTSTKAGPGPVPARALPTWAWRSSPSTTTGTATGSTRATLRCRASTPPARGS